MFRPSHLLFAALLFTASTPALAASKGGWDGTWAGNWGGKDTESTSITVEGKKVGAIPTKALRIPCRPAT
jgi:hypothetical protein